MHSLARDLSASRHHVTSPGYPLTVMDEDEIYGDIPDDDLIEAFSQDSQPLPAHPPKRKIYDDASSDYGTTPEASGDENDAATDEPPRKKYKVHVGAAVPEAKIIGATQAENMPDSSPYRIRGPIYMKPRVAAASTSENTAPFNGKLTSFFRSESSRINSLAKQMPSSVTEIRAPGQHATLDNNNSSFAIELQDLPDDAFSDDEFGMVDSFLDDQVLSQQLATSRQRLMAPRANLQQTTLFGGRTEQEAASSQTRKVYNYRIDQTPEPLTHHILDYDALETWTYPTNLGAIRDYQYSIVQNGLFHNLLVALPTGLGKTFIAATIMLNFFRWTKEAQIVFVAPTKPLVAQQVNACFNVVGIPRSTTTMLTGEQSPGLRAEEWASKRVFFMTPQTLENDLKSGIADPKRIVLLVVDEAHRATGNYAYVKVTSFLRRFNQSFRVLALTATPGSSVEQVQVVIDGLGISKIDIRTEESIDIRQYVHQRRTDEIVLDPSDEITMVKDLLSRALQPAVTQLCQQNAFYNRDPMSLTAYGLMQAQSNWHKSDVGRRAGQGLKGMMRSLFSTLASVAHSIKLLNYHGIGPFYQSIKDFRQPVEDGGKGGKYRKQIVQSTEFVKMMDLIRGWINRDGFVGHPKQTYLCDTVLNHFLDAGEGRLPEGAPPSSTRVIVFAEYRDSAEDIARVLNSHGPMVRASVFVGQADSARSAGMNQTKQLDTINKFKSGVFNVIVATSIGEEGLDIGQVDLIVLYDASSSPVRMLQRMGRTGRKRAGNVVCLLMRGKEEDNFKKSKHNYEEMQKMISSGEKFEFRHDLSRRIVPREIKPVVDKRMIDIPEENTIDSSMPEPRRRVAKKKKPAKKFHMPDGVETGFLQASRLEGNGAPSHVSVKKQQKIIQQMVKHISLESVLLTPTQELELRERYQSISGKECDEEVTMPDLTCQTAFQRRLGPVSEVGHGQFTKNCVRLFQILADSQAVESRYDKAFGDGVPDDSDWMESTVLAADSIADTPEAPEYQTPRPACRKQTKSGKQPSGDRIKAKMRNTKGKGKAKRSNPSTVLLGDSSDMEDSEDGNTPRRSHTQSQMPSSEGPGDDLDADETPSEDSDGDLGSLKDFLASDGHTSMAPTSSFSSTAPSLTGKAHARQHIQTRPPESPDQPEFHVRPPFIGSVPCDKQLSDKSSASQTPMRPVARPYKRRRIIDETDSEVD